MDGWQPADKALAAKAAMLAAMWAIEVHLRVTLTL